MLGAWIGAGGAAANALPCGRQVEQYHTDPLLDPDDCMTVLSVLALQTQAESAALISVPIGRASGAPALFLCIGLSNGVMMRARLADSGQLSDSRTRFLARARRQALPAAIRRP